MTAPKVPKVVSIRVVSKYKNMVFADVGALRLPTDKHPVAYLRLDEVVEWLKGYKSKECDLAVRGFIDELAAALREEGK